MRNLSDFPRKDRTLIIIGLAFIVLGLLGVFSAYLSMTWWFVLINGFSHILHRLLPIALVALGIYIIWASRTGRLHTTPHKDGSGTISRSRTDRKLLGVCGGFAQYHNLDSTVVRIIVLLLFIAFPLLISIVYIFLGFVMQSE